MSVLISLSLSTATWAQNDHTNHDHDGHDHAEETEHAEPHVDRDKDDEHEDHAEHGDHVGHDQSSGEKDKEASEDYSYHGGHDDHSDHDNHSGHSGHDDHEESVVSVSDAVLREFGITLAKANSGTLHEEVILPGEIQFNREQLAYVTPRYAGTVTGIEARLADRVEKGQVLATLESTDTLRPFEVRAPFSGTIVAYDITPGETVEAGISLFTVADLSSVWADLRIYQRDLNKVRRGQRVVIVNGHEGPSFTGTITYIAPTIDEHTRTGLARVVVDNQSGEWRPGQFVKGSVSIEEHQADIVIPRSAVLTHEGKTVVFVQTDEGFEPRPVDLGHSDATAHEVVGGLEAGETYVTRNAISLKAEMNKGSFGGHAGHVH